MPLIDITRPLDASAPVWPGDEPFSCGWSQRILGGDAVNVSWTRASVHNGTHMDAPLHVTDDGEDAASVPLEDLCGPCTVVDAFGSDVLGADLFEGLDLHRAPRVLVKTHDEPFDPWDDGFAPLDADAARLLAEAGVRCFGTDGASVDEPDSKELPSHHALIAGGVRILENLALWHVEPGPYELLAMPTKLVGLDGAPVRAALRPRG